MSYGDKHWTRRNFGAYLLTCNKIFEDDATAEELAEEFPEEFDYFCKLYGLRKKV